MPYVHPFHDWPNFTWAPEAILMPLGIVRHLQGKLLGKMLALGFVLQQEAELETLTLDVLKSTEIEGEFLNPEQVRSSIGRRLGMDITDWLLWFPDCLTSALRATDQILARVLAKATFREQHRATRLNERRQRLLINKLFDGFDGIQIGFVL